MNFVILLAGFLVTAALAYWQGRRSMSRERDLITLQAACYADAVLAIYNLPNLTVEDCRAMAYDSCQRAASQHL